MENLTLVFVNANSAWAQRNRVMQDMTEKDIITLANDDRGDDRDAVETLDAALSLLSEVHGGYAKIER